jgi:hypothetical protein
MKKASLAIVSASLLLAAIAAFVVFVPQRGSRATAPEDLPLPSPEKSATPSGGLVYRNETYGYTFSYPDGYVVRDFSPEMVSIGNELGGVFISAVDVIVAQQTPEEAAQTTTFDTFVHTRAQSMCASSGPSGNTTCTGIDLVQSKTTAGNIRGQVFYLRARDDLIATGDTVEYGKGPVYAFDLSGNVPTNAGALMVMNPVTRNADTVNTELLNAVVESLSIVTIETKKYEVTPSAAGAEMLKKGTQNIDLYLVQRLAYRTYGGMVFCSHDVLGAEEEEARILGYVWALCQEYYRGRDGSVQKGARASTPVMLILNPNEGSITVMSHQVPREGMQYAEDVRNMFPAAVQEILLSGDVDGQNARIAGLEGRIEQQRVQSFR